MNLRYREVFVSAYEPSHQQCLYEAGLSPKGYIPNWKNNKKKN